MNARRFLSGVFEFWPAKVLSIVSALLLAVFFQINKLEERTISVPLTIVLNDDFAPASAYPETVRLLLRGEKKAVEGVLDSDLTAKADFSSFVEKGSARVSVQVVKKADGPGVDPLEITRIDPGEITLMLEPRLSAVVPVVPAFRGMLESGYEIITYSIVPDNLEISGPESLVNRIRDVTTEYIELSGRSEDFTATVDIARNDALVNFLGPEKVEFRAIIQKTLMSQSFKDIPLHVTGLAKGLAVIGNLPSGEVTLLEARSEMAAFQVSEGFMILELSEMRIAGFYTVPVRVNAPPGISVESFSPLAVIVELVNEGITP